MRRIIFITAMLIVSISLFSQMPNAPSTQNSPKPQKPHLGIGLKAGLNFANITNAKDINNSSHTGFMIGAFLAPPSPGIFAYRTEIVYSRQGYDYKANNNTGNVNLDYIIMPHLMGINITKFVQIQLGGQVAYLLNAKADSTNKANSNNPNNPYQGIMSMYNRFDYGAAAGIEIHPFKGILIGARYNISFGDVYKDPSTYMSQNPQMPASFLPSVNAKNNVVQVFAGYQF